MRRRSSSHPLAILVLTLTLVLAGCLQPAPDDGTSVETQGTDAPPLPPESGSQDAANASRSGADAWAPNVEPCVADVSEPSFDDDADVTTKTKSIPGNVTRARVHVQSYHGGIYLAPWNRSEAQVQVGEVDPNGELEPQVTLRVEDGTLHVRVTVNRTGGGGDGPIVLGPLTDPRTYAEVKVRVPHLVMDQVQLRDAPPNEERDDDSQVWIRWHQGGGWDRVLAHDLEARSFTVSTKATDASIARVRATAAALSTGSAHTAMHRVASRNASIDAGSGDLCASLVRSDALRMGTGSGHVDARGIDAGRLRLDTGSGDVHVGRTRADTARVSTGSGEVQLQHVLFQELQADAGSGDIQGELVPQASGGVQVRTGSGHIDLAFPPGPDRGYLVHASSSSGHVKVHITNGTVDESGGDRDGPNETVTGRTHGFDARPVQVEVQAQTSSGDVNVTA